MDKLKEIKIYTLNEVEAILSVTRRTIYNYIKNGDLRASKIGKNWRVQYQDLQSFIDSGMSIVDKSA
ncbi:helix-turn-helix domain-containing protein [Acetobacterium paludosum]|uniref:Helix-turn-helix domain-containing protein n=1 Tax=Acetobacterium paludosum TaxID=52693 RepID=A0A923I179_9FIRM|nr:helix-turn-helix domain-containing protein [Acetobacterium paludosum]